MIGKDDFSKMMLGEYDILLKQTEGLSHADSLLQPDPGGNCLNWVMGHLVWNLVDMLKALDGNVPIGLPELERYKIGSEPIREETDDIPHLEVLIQSYGLLTKAITDRIVNMSAEEFDEDIDFWQGQSRRGYIAFFYFFHNTYHLGQIEQLRNLAGKTEKVI